MMSASPPVSTSASVDRTRRRRKRSPCPSCGSSRTAIASPVRPLSPGSLNVGRLRAARSRRPGQCLGLGIRQQAIAVHRDAVGLAQEHQLLALRPPIWRRSRSRSVWNTFATARASAPWARCPTCASAIEHLAIAAPARDEPDADIRPDPYRFRHAPGSHRRIEAGSRTRRRARGRPAPPTTGKGAYLSALNGLLAAGDQLLDLAPRRDVDREQREAEIGAGREIVALVVDDERLEALLLHQRDRLA